MSDDDIKLPPMPDLSAAEDWEAAIYAWGIAAILADRASRAAQAPAADAQPGYAGVTVWVGDMKCTMAVPKQILKASRCDALLECFQKARHAIATQGEKHDNQD